VRKIIISALAALTALAVPTGAHAEGAVVFGEDEANDWGVEVDPELDPIGRALGQDLVGAAVEIDGDTANFIISVAELPAIGGAPEVSRYTWNINLMDGNTELNHVELDGKYTNYSRGTCDPTAGKCPPPRDPGPAPFFLRGNCRTQGALPPPSPTPGTNLTICEEFATIEASFDATAATITIPVPIASLAAAAEASCFDITAGTNIFGGFISAAPSAFVTSSAMPLDFMEASFTEAGTIRLPVGDCA
jgi:hypothetical protein